MKRTPFLAHLVLPVLFALTGLVLSFHREPPSFDLLLAHGFGVLFYAGPHLLWAAFAALAKPTVKVRHAGFVAASLTLTLIGALSLRRPRDPSGLPFQWVVYWPLAAFLLLLVVVGWVLAGRPRARA